MSALNAKIGADARRALDAYAKREKLSFSDAARALVVLGLGGTATEARAVNAQVAARRRAVRAALAPASGALDGFDELTEASAAKMRGHATRARGAAKTQVHVRLPGVLARAVRAHGHLRAVILRGLDKVK